MSRKKKNPYDKLQLLASIDTVSIKTTDDFIIPAQTQDGRPFRGAKLVGRDNRSETPIIKLNVNTYAERELYNLDEYMNNLQLMLEDMHIQNYWYSRVDIRFDSFIYGWDDLAKLNRLVIHIDYFIHVRPDLAEPGALRGNAYKSLDNWYEFELDDTYRRDSAQIEHYNKLLDEPTGSIKSRLEVRTTRIAAPSSTNPFSLDSATRARVEGWKNAFRGYAFSFADMLRAKNTALIWKYENNRDVYNSPCDFIQKHVGSIWTKAQLDELYAMMGVNDPQKARRNFVNRHRGLLTFIEIKDFQLYIDYLCSRLDSFQNSQNDSQVSHNAA